MSAADEAFVAVAIGAVLAAGGGIVAQQVSAFFERRRQARSTALLFGDVLAAVETLLRLAEQASIRPHQLQTLTLRFLRAARREVDVYDRNREMLFSISSPSLRVRIHTYMVRLAILLDRLVDQYEVVTMDGVITSSGLRNEVLETEASLDFRLLLKNRVEIPALLIALQPLAREQFDGYARATQGLSLAGETTDGNQTDWV